MQLPPVNYSKTKMGVGAFVSQVESFLRDYFRGAYEDSYEFIRNRSVYICTDGFALFLRHNFTAVFARQLIKISVGMENNLLRFKIHYNTRFITDDLLSKMTQTASLSDFSFRVEADGVTVDIPTVLDFGIDFNALGAKAAYNSLAYVFTYDDAFIFDVKTNV